MTYPRLERCTGPACPDCGCQDTEILREPNPGSWWASGQAYCRNCRARFSFREVEPESAPVAAPEPPAEDFRIVKQPLCPECQSASVRVTHTLPAIRRYQCKECGKRFKRARGS